jgi:transcriptional regulator
MLTTLCQPMTAMGEASVEILLDIIEGRGVHRHVTLPTALREGASVRQLKH